MTQILPIGRDQGDSIVTGLNGIASALRQGSGGYNVVVPQNTVYPSGTTITYSASEFAGRQCSMPTVGKTYMLYLNGTTQEAMATQESAGVTLAFAGMTAVFNNGAMTATLPSHVDSVTFGIAEKVASSGGESGESGGSAASYRETILPLMTVSISDAATNVWDTTDASKACFIGTLPFEKSGAGACTCTVDGVAVNAHYTFTSMSSTDTQAYGYLELCDKDTSSLDRTQPLTISEVRASLGASFLFAINYGIDFTGTSESSLTIYAAFESSETTHTISAERVVTLEQYGLVTYDSGPVNASLADGMTSTTVAITAHIDDARDAILSCEADILIVAYFGNISPQLFRIGIDSAFETNDSGTTLITFLPVGFEASTYNPSTGEIVLNVSKYVVYADETAPVAVALSVSRLVRAPIKIFPTVRVEKQTDYSQYTLFDGALLEAINASFTEIINAGSSNNWSDLRSLRIIPNS